LKEEEEEEEEEASGKQKIIIFPTSHQRLLVLGGELLQVHKTLGGQLCRKTAWWGNRRGL